MTINLKNSNSFYRNFLLMLALLATTQSAMASYKIDKIRLVLSQNAPVDTMNISNPANPNKTSLQVSAMQWTQTNGHDTYTPTHDLILSPPLMTIAPEGNQTLRIGLRKPVQLPDEQAYRVYIQEVTPHAAIKLGVQFKMNVSLPLFVQPLKPIYAAELHLIPADSSHSNLSFANTGTMHLRVSSIIIRDKNDSEVASNHSLFYLLPHQAITIPLMIKKSDATQSLTIDIKTDHDPIKQSLTLS